MRPSGQVGCHAAVGRFDTPRGLLHHRTPRTPYPNCFSDPLRSQIAAALSSQSRLSTPHMHLPVYANNPRSPLIIPSAFASLLPRFTFSFPFFQSFPASESVSLWHTTFLFPASLHHIHTTEEHNKTRRPGERASRRGASRRNRGCARHPRAGRRGSGVRCACGRRRASGASR